MQFIPYQDISIIPKCQYYYYTISDSDANSTQSVLKRNSHVIIQSLLYIAVIHPIEVSKIGSFPE